MNARLLGAIFACAIAPASYGWLTHDFVPVDNSGVRPGDDPLVPDFNDGSYFTFDLVVTILEDPPPSPPDDWEAGTVVATIDGPAAFFQHPIGGDVVPDPGQVEDYPALEFDSYFAGAPGEPIVFVEGPVSESRFISATWFDTAYPDVDSYPIVRFTVHWPGPEEAVLTIEGASLASNAQGDVEPFVFALTVPEPTGLTLLGVGGAGALWLGRR